MAITTCKAFKAAERRLDADHRKQRKPIEDKLGDCLKEAKELFDGADTSTPAGLEAARDRLVDDRKKCIRKFETSVAPIDQLFHDNSDQLFQGGHDGLGFTVHLIIAWKELESDALIVQKLEQVEHRPAPPIIFVDSFDELARELKFDRCAIDLTLVAVVKENALVLKGEERSFASLVTAMTPTTNLKVDESLHLRARQIGKQPSTDAHSGLHGFQRMLEANGLDLVLESWRATQLKVRNKQWPDDPVVDCVPSILGRGPIGKPTDSKGKTTLTVFNLTDGRYQLELTPNDSSTDPAGPNTNPTKPPKLRVWEPLKAEVTVKSERIISVAPNSALTLKGDQLTADLQPVWMRSYLRSPRPKAPTMIVVHHTDSVNTAKMLDQFTNKAHPQPNADYTICPDGQTIKLVMDFDYSGHAGWSYWKGQVNPDNNRDSFGIEIMHVPGTKYSTAQIDSLIRLLNELIDAHPTIKTERIIGHSEIATTDKKKALLNRVLNRRPEDPGPLFPWDKLRKLANPLGIPVRPTAPPIGSSDLLTFFKDFPDAQLQPGDDDKTFTYGGQPRDPSKVPAQLITTLQTRLNAIGYSCVPTGHYNFQTQMAVSAFQMNFVQDEALKNSIRQQVTRKTAKMIERVA